MTTPIDNFEDTIANCSAWQTITGTASAAAAKAFIYQFGANTRPSAPAMYIREAGRDKRCVGTNSFIDSGTIEFEIELAVSGTTYEQQYDAARESVEGLLAEAALKGRAGVGLLVGKWEIRDQRKSERHNAANYWIIDGAVEWPF